MAITVTMNTTRTPSSQKPTGYSDPVVSDLTGVVAQANFSTEIDGSEVDADPVVGFTNIRTATGTWLSGTFLPTTLGIDATNTIVAVGYIESVELKTSDKFTLDEKNFVVNGKVVFQKTA